MLVAGAAVVPTYLACGLRSELRTNVRGLQMSSPLPIYVPFRGNTGPVLPTWLEISRGKRGASETRTLTLLCEDGPLNITLPDQFGTLPCTREELVRLLHDAMLRELSIIELEKP